jgi:hypothetical protein
MTLYTHETISEYLTRCIERGQEVYEIPGCLLDSYIVLPDEKYKGAIIKEEYLNEWSSAQSLRFFNKTSKRTQKIIDLLESGDEEKAAEIFYKTMY